MARTRNPKQRIAELLEAGTTVFRRKGFKRTQMSDIAEEMNCSTGTLYNYVDSKEALFEHAIVAGFTQVLPDSKMLPLILPKPDARQVITERAKQIAEGSGLALANQLAEAGNPAEEITLIICDFFLFFCDYHPVLEMIESSQLDYPDVAKAYLEARSELVFEPWIRWVQHRQHEGRFRQDIDPEWTVRYLIEMIAMGAWKIRHHSDTYDEEKARDAIVQIALTTLLRDEDRI